MLHLDCFSGISGNMMLGALIDLGVSRRQLDAGLKGLGVEYKLRIRNVQRGTLAARHVEVVVPSSRKKKSAAQKKHDHAEPHLQRGGHGQSYRQVCKVIERAKLDARVCARALAVFDALAVAEARVHGVSREEVHFHEVGAVDAIVDITGVAIGLEVLGIEHVTASPVALGHGSVDTEHGRLPLPAPATIELLRGIPTVPAHVAWESVTPTGAAILRTITDSFSALPAMTIDRVGHGAGNDRSGPMPNILRAVLGEAGVTDSDRVVSLECNLDDFNPEHFDDLMDRLFEGGALDVSLQNAQMKKNRPGFLVRVLAKPSERIALSGLLMTHSTTLGVRCHEWDRLVLPRHSRKVATDYGRIGVKYVRQPSGRVEVSAEYDDCKRAARKFDVPLREVIRAAEDAARETIE